VIRLQGLVARAKALELAVGLVIDDLELASGPAEGEASPFSLRLAAPAELVVRISALSLAAFLEKKAPGGLEDFAVELREGKAFVEANKQVLFTAARAKAVAVPRIVDGKSIHVDIESAEIMGASALSLLQGQVAAMNPVLDVTDLPFSVTLDRLEIEPGWLILRGQATMSH
jgi:hypothetical protein